MTPEERLNNIFGEKQQPQVLVTMLSMTEEDFERRLRAAIEESVQAGVAIERKRTENREIDESSAISFIVDNTRYSCRSVIRKRINDNLEYRFDDSTGRNGTRYYRLIDIIELAEVINMKKQGRKTIKTRISKT